MAEFEKEQYKFPDEIEDKGKPLEASAEEVEYIVEDDTPPEDRGREPLPTEVVKKLEVADEENEELDPKAQIERIKQYKKVWNDERRAKEAAERERQAAFEALDRLNKENKQLKAQYSAGEKTYIETVQNAADTTLAMAKREYKEALESGEADRIVEEAFESGILKSDETRRHDELLTTVLFVVALGPDCYKDKERFSSGPWCKEGDFILVRPNAGTRVVIHGREFRIINDDSVEAVVQDPRGITRKFV